MKTTIVVVIYILIGLGFFMQSYERNIPVLISIKSSVVWPFVLGLVLGSLSADIRERNKKNAKSLQ